MTRQYFANFEIPLADENLTVVESGTGVCERANAAAKNGGYGLSCSTPTASLAYLIKPLSISVSPGESVFFSEWRRAGSTPASTCNTTQWYDGGTALGNAYDRSDGRRHLTFYHDTGFKVLFLDGLSPGEWVHWTYEFRRATTSISSDGGCGVWRNSLLENSDYTFDNYHKLQDFSGLRDGLINGAAGYSTNTDEIKIGTTRVEVQPTVVDQFGIPFSMNQSANTPALAGSCREERRV